MSLFIVVRLMMQVLLEIHAPIQDVQQLAELRCNVQFNVCQCLMCFTGNLEDFTICFFIYLCCSCFSYLFALSGHLSHCFTNCLRYFQGKKMALPPKVLCNCKTVLYTTCLKDTTLCRYCGKMCSWSYPDVTECRTRMLETGGIESHI